MKKILVTGGAGYIGSHMVEMLVQKGFEPIVLDDLSTGSKDLVLNAELVEGSCGDKQLVSYSGSRCTSLTTLLNC